MDSCRCQDALEPLVGAFECDKDGDALGCHSIYESRCELLTRTGSVFISSDAGPKDRVVEAGEAARNPLHDPNGSRKADLRDD